MSNRAKQVAKYYNQCKLPKWATVLGVVLLAFGIVAAGVSTAIFLLATLAQPFKKRAERSS